MKPQKKKRATMPANPLSTVMQPRGAKPSDATAVTVISDLPGLSAAGSVSITKKIAAVSRWRENYNPLRALSLQRAVTMAESYAKGWMADLQWTYFYIEQTDPDLFALVERRSSRLLEMDYSAVKKKDADKGLADEQAAFLEERFSKIDNLYEAVEHLASASFRGYAHCEKWYDDQGVLNHLEIVDQWNCVRDGLSGGWKYNPQALQTAYFGLDDSLVMPSENFLYRDTRRHINRIALLKFLRASLAEKDWDAFIEIYGIPSGIIIAPPNIPEGKAPEFEAAAREISEGGSGYLPNGSLYEANDRPRGNSPFRERLEYLSEKLILAGTGGMLTMLARSGSGTLAGGAHTDVFEQIAKAEARKVSELINEQLAVEWLEEAYPGKPQAAYFALSANEETKVGEIIAHITGLATAGFQVDAEEVTERTGYAVTLKTPPPGEDGAPPSLGGLDSRNSDPETGDPASVENRRIIRNRSATAMAASREAIFKANAAAQEMAAKRASFKPLAERLAAILAIDDDEKLQGAVHQLRADSAKLYGPVMRGAPSLAKTYHHIYGTALLSGAVEHAQSQGKPAKRAKS